MKNYPPKEWVPNLQGRLTPESMSELSNKSLRMLMQEIDDRLDFDGDTPDTILLLRKILEMLKLEDR